MWLLFLVSCSILMAYTVSVANSYGRLISELKRQIETVRQAGYLGKLLENMERDMREGRCVSLPPVFTQGGAE